jgi:hypothetical protein
MGRTQVNSYEMVYMPPRMKWRRHTFVDEKLGGVCKYTPKEPRALPFEFWGYFDESVQFHVQIESSVQDIIHTKEEYIDAITDCCLGHTTSLYSNETQNKKGL